MRYQLFNLKLPEETSTTRPMSRMWHGCVYKGNFCNWLSCTLLAALHRPMETTSLQIELVYLFSKFSSLGSVYCIYFSYWHLHWCFFDALSRSIFVLCYCLWVENCVKLQYYCLDINANFRFRFINCKDWTIIFFHFKFSLTILCTIRIWLLIVGRVLKCIISSHTWDWDVLGHKRSCG